MGSRSEFLNRVEELRLTHAERAIALLWYYRRVQEFDERTASEIADDLHAEGYSKPNTTRLKESFKKNKFTTKGKRQDSYQINARYLNELNEIYEKYLESTAVKVSDTILPYEWVDGTRRYLEALVTQINGTYEFGYYDACATLCRRLMESLIIEVYIHKKRHSEIQNDGVFVTLVHLVHIISTDNQIPLSRSARTTMDDVKDIGDVAAHDRTYITRKEDLSSIILLFRRLIRELMDLSGIIK